eukprot:TRINITY_DN8739_c1_g1_i1.p1 TRINITY_DN8739_c1_g1~~TRINITY_DN8739_c1_g1_i1.p1  ORF type:complete len:822 (+),score=292.83 TRINITY_DN8739_c1_g1_i1:96-2468(+)
MAAALGGGEAESEGTAEQELRALQQRQRENTAREQQLADASGVLLQLTTVATLLQKRAEQECFDPRAQPTGKLFLVGIPAPADFAACPEVGGEGLPELECAKLLSKEIAMVLRRAAGPGSNPRVSLCFHSVSGAFTGCGKVTCSSVTEAARLHQAFMEEDKWYIPPQETPVGLYHMEEAQEPVVLVRGTDNVDFSTREFLERYGVVADISIPPPRAERRRGGTTPAASPLSGTTAQSPTKRRQKEFDAECPAVRFASLEDALCALANCHRRPVPNRDEYVVDMLPDWDCGEDEAVDELRDALRAIGGNPDGLTLVSVSPSGMEPGAHCLRVRYSGPCEEFCNVQEAGGLQILSLVPPPLLLLRLRRRPRSLRAEDKAMLIGLEDDLHAEKQRTRALYQELHTLLLPLAEDKSAAVLRARGELSAMRIATGWDERKQFTTHTQNDRENRIHVLLQELGEMHVQQRLQAKEDECAQEQLEEIAHELHRRDDVQAEHDRLVEELAQLRTDQQDMQEDMRSLKRILAVKKRRAHRLATADDAAEVRLLEADKTVMRTALRRAQEKQRSAENTVAAQHLRIERLLQDTERLAHALVLARPAWYDPDAPPCDEGGVPVAEYEQLQLRFERARRRLRAKERLLQGKDIMIETYERHCEALERNRRSSARLHGTQQRALRDHVRASQSFIREQAAAAEQRKRQLLGGGGGSAWRSRTYSARPSPGSGLFARPPRDSGSAFGRSPSREPCSPLPHASARLSLNQSSGARPAAHARGCSPCGGPRLSSGLSDRRRPTTNG